MIAISFHPLFYVTKIYLIWTFRKLDELSKNISSFCDEYATRNNSNNLTSCSFVTLSSPVSIRHPVLTSVAYVRNARVCVFWGRRVVSERQGYRVAWIKISFFQSLWLAVAPWYFSLLHSVLKSPSNNFATTLLVSFSCKMTCRKAAHGCCLGKCSPSPLRYCGASWHQSCTLDCMVTSIGFIRVVPSWTISYVSGNSGSDSKSLKFKS